jgi:hypothetical protein
VDLLDQLEEGGRPLSGEERYLAARFVHHISVKDAGYIPQLAQPASIGLLVEVVDDFIKPTTTPGIVDLTIVVDAPLALDYLGLSGKALQTDVRNVLDSLKSIGCKIIVYPVSCGEMQRNLKSMLALPREQRHGYTHQALQRSEVLPEFVEARNPEKALEAEGIQVRTISLDDFPHQHRFFDADKYEDG